MEIYIIDIWLSKLNYGWTIKDMPKKIREEVRKIIWGRKGFDR